MTFLHIVILAVVQGIAAFLPIGASGHRMAVAPVLGWPEQSSVIGVAIQAGTLLAVLAYFWRDVWDMLTGAAGAFAGRKGPGLKLFLFVAVATLPAAAGYAVLRYLDRGLHGAEVVAWATLALGLLLGIVDRLCMTVRRIEHMSYAAALFVGAAQVIALIPGVGRTGMGMTACRLLGIERRDAARFSILLAVPAILGGACIAALDLYSAGAFAVGADAALAAVLSFAAALGAIAFLMRWLAHATFTPFAIYRVILGGGLLYWVYS